MERTPSTGGLATPVSLGVSMTELEAILEKFNTQPSVDEDLKKMGLHKPSQPNTTLAEVTGEMLSTTDERAYTDMYANQLAWFNYLTPTLAEIISGLLQAENQMKLIDARIRKRLKETNKLRPKEERLKEAEMDVEVLDDPIYQEALLEAQKLKQYKLSLEAISDIASRNMKVISRQIEIRRLALEGQFGENGMRNRIQPRPMGGQRR
jgi:hypothetical protein